MAEHESALEQLVAAVRASARYRHVNEAFVRRVGAQELAKGRTLKAAVKATKDRLHQVGGAYLEGRLDYGAYLEQLRQAFRTRDPADLRPVCAEIMARHASSRERLPILAEFYGTIFRELPPIRTLLDLGCGLNPLALPWMPLAADAGYCACDVYEDLVDFVREFLALVGVRGRAWVCDLLGDYPSERVDLALVLKLIPCLEQVDRSAGRRLLDGLNADHLLVSFPVRSLCGVRKGMPATYEAHFRELVEGRGWRVRRFAFASELAFLVSK